MIRLFVRSKRIINLVAILTMIIIMYNAKSISLLNVNGSFLLLI